VLKKLTSLLLFLPSPPSTGDVATGRVLCRLGRCPRH
jgi:hypothetical protein